MKRRELLSWLANTSAFGILAPTLNPLALFDGKKGVSLLPYHPTQIVIKTVIEKGSLSETLSSWRDKGVLDNELNRLRGLGHLVSSTSTKSENSLTVVYEFANETYRNNFASWLVSGEAVSIEKMRKLGIKTYHNLS